MVTVKPPGEDSSLYLLASGGPKCSLAMYFNLYLLRHMVCSVFTSLSRFLTSYEDTSHFGLKAQLPVV